jgi:hypothetical protein
LTLPASSLEFSHVPISTQGNTRILKGKTIKLSGFQFPPIRVRGNTNRPLFSKIPLKGLFIHSFHFHQSENFVFPCLWRLEPYYFLLLYIIISKSKFIIAINKNIFL